MKNVFKCIIRISILINISSCKKDEISTQPKVVEIESTNYHYSKDSDDSLIAYQNSRMISDAKIRFPLCKKLNPKQSCSFVLIGNNGTNYVILKKLVNVTNDEEIADCCGTFSPFVFEVPMDTVYPLKITLGINKFKNYYALFQAWSFSTLSGIGSIQIKKINDSTLNITGEIKLEQYDRINFNDNVKVVNYNN